MAQSLQERLGSSDLVNALFGHFGHFGPITGPDGRIIPVLKTLPVEFAGAKPHERYLRGTWVSTCWHGRAAVRRVPGSKAASHEEEW